MARGTLSPWVRDRDMYRGFFSELRDAPTGGADVGVAGDFNGISFKLYLRERGKEMKEMSVTEYFNTGDIHVYV